MKRITIVFVAILLVFALAGCTQSKTETPIILPEDAIRLTIGTDSGSYEGIKEELLKLTYKNSETLIFSSVDIDMSSGLFYSVCTFKASVNSLDDKTNATTLAVTMPTKISQNTGGRVNGDTLVCKLGDTDTGMIIAVSEKNNVAPVLIMGGLLVLAAAAFVLFIKFKK